MRTCLMVGFLLILLGGCGTPSPVTEVVQRTPSPATRTTATATPHRPTATARSATPTARPATPTTRPATATALPPTAEPTDVPLPTPTPPADLPAGWVYHDVTQLGGFGVALPPAWNVTRLDRDGLDDLADTAPLFPQAGQSPEQLAASGMKLVACECLMDDPELGASALFIMSDTMPVALSLDEAVADLIRGIEYSPMLAGPINHARIPHPAGPTEAVQYRMWVGEQVLTATHYVLIKDRQLVFVGIVASVDRAEQQTPTYYQIMQTFRFTSASAEPM